MTQFVRVFYTQRRFVDKQSPGLISVGELCRESLYHETFRIWLFVDVSKTPSTSDARCHYRRCCSFMIMISPHLIRFDRRRYFDYMAVYVSPNFSIGHLSPTALAAVKAYWYQCQRNDIVVLFSHRMALKFVQFRSRVT